MTREDEGGKLWMDGRTDGWTDGRTDGWMRVYAVEYKSRKRSIFLTIQHWGNRETMEFADEGPRVESYSFLLNGSRVIWSPRILNSPSQQRLRDTRPLGHHVKEYTEIYLLSIGIPGRSPGGATDIREVGENGYRRRRWTPDARYEVIPSPSIFNHPVISGNDDSV